MLLMISLRERSTFDDFTGRNGYVLMLLSRKTRFSVILVWRRDFPPNIRKKVKGIPPQQKCRRDVTSFHKSPISFVKVPTKHSFWGKALKIVTKSHEASLRASTIAEKMTSPTYNPKKTLSVNKLPKIFICVQGNRDARKNVTRRRFAFSSILRYAQDVPLAQ